MNKTIKSILILLLVVLALASGCADKKYTTITALQAKEMMDSGDVIVVDVREEYEFEEGHIENAILLPLGQIEEKAESTFAGKNAKILIYCRSGRRSADAASKFANMGYKNIYDMGGIIDWQNQGYSIVK